jgi:SAM-dependent methyltransferase
MTQFNKHSYRSFPESVLSSERAYFDKEAAGLEDGELILRPDTIERYRKARPGPVNTPKEHLFATLMPLEGKRVLDYGCGTGEITCLLAACGAHVVGFDLSPLAIEKARRRAGVLGLVGQVEVDVRVAGHTGYPRGSFDLVLGFAILHHLHQNLPRVYAEIDGLLKPEGAACFIEPVANSPCLRALRRLTPLRCDATPDERQLYYQDFEPLRRYFSQVEFTHFYCAERLHRVLGCRGRSFLRRLDHHAQRLLPYFRRYYGTLVVTARR